MKNTLFATILILLSFSAYSQKCKFKVDKTDPISGKKIQIITLKKSLLNVIGYYREGDETGIEMVIMQSGDGNVPLPAGSSIELKLGDNTILSLSSKEDVKPAVQALGQSLMETFVVKYPVSAQQAQQIIDKGLTYARAHTLANRVANIEFKKGDTEGSMKDAKCIF